MEKMIELVKETKIDRIVYWVKVNGSWSHVFMTLEEAEEKYEQLLTQGIFEPSMEVLKSATI
jgi:hypothetical protein